MELTVTPEDMAALFAWRPAVELLSPLALEHLQVIVLTRMVPAVPDSNEEAEPSGENTDPT